MKDQPVSRPLRVFALALSTSWAATGHADPIDLFPPAVPPTAQVAAGASESAVLASVSAAAWSLGRGLTGSVQSTFSAASLSQIIGETVFSTVGSTKAAAGSVSEAVAGTVQDTLAGTSHIADTVMDTVGTTTRSLVEAPKRMLDYAQSLIGTPYKWGGTSVIDGLDCSGFVREVVEAATGRLLPRTAKEMSRAGDQIAYADLQPGDLVFFNTRRRPYSHVGIYLGDGEFVHGASGKRSGRQVRIDKLDNNYYRARYNGARRIPIAE